MSQNEQFSTDLAAIREKLKKPVVFVGMMGSGKTRVGKKLASMLKIQFLDTDRLIEEKAGRSVTEIFKIDGEAKFREVEKKTIIELLNKDACVISGGGGMMANEGVADALKAKAVTIWLQAEPSDILKRIRDTRSRPLLTGDNPEKTLSELIEKRKPFYERADIAVNTVGGSVESSVVAVIKGLRDFLKDDTF